jgi:amino acid adenylation domain-containing protein
MYTSGSTGRPKGVMVEHASLANFAGWYRRAIGIGTSDRVAMVNALGFDGSVMDLWPPLTTGASIVVADPDVRLSATALRDWLVRNSITLTFLTTALAESVLALPWPEQTRLRVLLTGGDVLRRRPSACTPFRLLNGYGPTETTVFATTAFVEPADAPAERPPIGRPIDGATAYVLDPRLEPVPTGVLGELYVGGAGVARGYVGQPELTAERFVRDRFAADPEARLYRTGDLVRQRADGTLDFVGRRDRQLKLRGNRIEPDEIAAALCRHSEVAEVHVAVREDGPGGSRRTSSRTRTLRRPLHRRRGGTSSRSCRAS